MGQAEIIEILEKLNKPSSRGEIAQIMGEDPIKVSHWLATLLKHDEVETINLDRFEAAKYNCRRSIRLYYIKTEEVKQQNGRTTTKTIRKEIRNC